jgi:hypothetical protein
MRRQRLRVRSGAFDELLSCSGLAGAISPVTWAGLDHQLFYAVVDATDRCVSLLLDLTRPAAPRDWADVHPNTVAMVVEQPTSPVFSVLLPGSHAEALPGPPASAEQAAAQAGLAHTVDMLRKVRETQLVPLRAELATARRMDVAELADVVTAAAGELRARAAQRRLPGRLRMRWRVRRWHSRACRSVVTEDVAAVMDAVMITRTGWHAAADYIERVAERRAGTVAAMIRMERGFLAECYRLRQRAERELALGHVPTAAAS